jgi:phosphoenolpyruvate carboxykinase (ATP)
MARDIYDEQAYHQFAENLRPLLDGPNITHPTLDQLRQESIATGTKSIYGSYGWRATISSRIAPRTVYLGSPPVRLPHPTDLQKSLIQNAPEELHRVLHFVRTLPFVHTARQMGENDVYNPLCHLYVSVSDPKNYRIAYMWASTVRQPTRSPGPEFTMLHIPEEHPLRQQVLTIPEYNLNIALGTDYMGEDKKGFLRQAMWYVDEHGMLGLHAGTKMVTVRDPKDNRLKVYGIFMFGLTATGKSTWSCHQLGLDYANRERTEVTQDDIVFLKRDGSALGSEPNGFFVKTDVSKDLQEAMYYALIDESALYENVMIDSHGRPDFLDESLTANGRAVIQRDKLRIRRGRRMMGISSKGIDLPPLDELDGLVFAFITRRNTIMPFSQELTPEQAVLAYLWGESTHSYASQPLKAGESVRIVGTDPFIVGSRARKVNRFHEIIMGLVDRYPGKVRFYQYNTGGLGEILEEYTEHGEKRKRVVRKVERVPINLMAAIQRGDLRETNRYEKGRLGTQEIMATAEGNLSQYDPRKYYSEEQIEAYVREIVEGRREFTAEIAEEGLNPKLIQAAERSFSVVSGDRISVAVPEQIEPEEPETVPSWRPRARIPRGRGFRRR